MSADMGNGEAMSIGEAAKRTQLSRKAIRLYEKRGLLPPARRSDAGYRLYSGDDLDVLHFIRRAKALGLHLNEVGEILDLQRGGEHPCSHVLGLLDDRIAEIDRMIADLQRLRGALRTARDAAEAGRRRGQRSVVCRIIESAPTDQR